MKFCRFEKPHSIKAPDIMNLIINFSTSIFYKKTKKTADAIHFQDYRIAQQGKSYYNGKFFYLEYFPSEILPNALEFGLYACILIIE